MPHGSPENSNQKLVQTLDIMRFYLIFRKGKRERCRALMHKNKYMTLNGGSLGSWIDEERSKVR
jgi:hypothetical protein